ncbi:hypothetical protein PG997_011717 [Apiospora hydei]|uniref:Uncharacterized protein n=1 Tax=Apiospora hydei TaxID=1337664 RepID=A0ABR1V3V9_9PEZI
MLTLAPFKPLNRDAVMLVIGRQAPRGWKLVDSEPIANANSGFPAVFVDDRFTKFVVPVNVRLNQDGIDIWVLVVVRRKPGEADPSANVWAVDFYDPNEPEMEENQFGHHDRRKRHLKVVKAMAKRWFGDELQFDVPPSGSLPLW